MDLRKYRLVFIAVTGIVSLIVASPALSRLLVYPRTEFFTELWILDSNRTTKNYPFNITRNYNYSIFLGIENRLGYCAYYLIEVKFRNQSQSAPDTLNRTPSSLPALFNISVFLSDGGVWELPLTFSFDYGYNETLSQIELYTLKLNDVVLNIKNCTIALDSEKEAFYGDLFFETWLYNNATADFQYHERFVSLRFNMTVS
jgi:hypothetical protein